jgi:hypothetical protein
MNWEITKWSGNITDDEQDKNLPAKFDFNYAWKAYDSDKILYAEGTIENLDEYILSDILRYLENWGVTHIKLYEINKAERGNPQRYIDTFE